MSTHIFPKDNVKKTGDFMVNKKEINLLDFKNGRYNNLTTTEQQHFKDYLEANKL